MNSIELLGQNLFREALNDKSLEPFEVASRDMQNPEIPQRCRANIYKAVRFGLAGVAIHGWHERVTEPLDTPYELGGRTVSYRFTPNYFPPDEKPEPAPCADPEYDQTSGWLTLERASVQCERAMYDFLDDPMGEVRGIPIGDVQTALLKYVLAAHETGLHDIPDMFNNNKALSLNIYDEYHRYGNYSKYDSDSIRHGLAGSTRTLILSTANGISACMREAVPASDQHVRIYEVLRHAARASQRQDGLYTVVDSEKDYPEFTWGSATDETELMWERKYQRPPRQLAEGEIPKNVGYRDLFRSYLRRNKCPAGYTLEATDVMPILKLRDSLMTYIIESRLNDPELFACIAP